MKGKIRRNDSVLNRAVTNLEAWTGARDLSLFHSAQIGSHIQPASYSMGTGDLSLGIKQPGHEADNSPPFSAETKSG
jgi:hypothetical protein